MRRFLNSLSAAAVLVGILFCVSYRPAVPQQPKLAILV